MPKMTHAPKNVVDSNEANVTTPPPVGRGVSPAPAIKSLLSRYHTSTRLSESGKNYYERLRDALCNQPEEASERKVVVAELQHDKMAVRVFYHPDTKRAVTVIFNENLVIDDTSLITRLQEVTTEVTSKIQGAIVCQHVIVTPEDYPLIDNMIDGLSDVLAVLNSEPGDTITSEMLRHTPLSVTFNQQAVQGFIQSKSPHAIQTRNDVGFLVQVEHTVNGQHGRIVEYTPLFACVGYTQFIKDCGIQYQADVAGRISPVFTITDIVSNIPDVNVISAALPLAVDAVMNRAAWLRPYSKFGKADPNLGELFSADGGVSTKPWFCDTLEARNQLIAQRFSMPWLAIDITQGRLRLPGLDNIIYDPTLFEANLAHFLGRVDSKGMPEIRLGQVTVNTSMVGSVLRNGQLVDSRTVDYMSLIKDVKDIRRLGAFLQPPATPRDRTAQISEFVTGVKDIYLNTTCVLNADFVRQIASSLYLNVTYKEDSQNQIGLSNLPAGGNNYANFTTFGQTSSNVNTYNPYQRF